MRSTNCIRVRDVLLSHQIIVIRALTDKILTLLNYLNVEHVLHSIVHALCMRTNEIST